MFYKFFQNLLTKKKTKIPLFWCEFNYNLFKKKGKQGSCMLKIHPILKDDPFIKRRIEDLVEYIRDNYDLEEL